MAFQERSWPNLGRNYRFKAALGRNSGLLTLMILSFWLLGRSHKGTTPNASI